MLNSSIDFRNSLSRGCHRISWYLITFLTKNKQKKAASNNLKSNQQEHIVDMEYNFLHKQNKLSSTLFQLWFNISHCYNLWLHKHRISAKFNLCNLSVKPSPPFQGILISHVSHILPTISDDWLRCCQWRDLGECPGPCSDLPVVVLHSSCSTSGHRFPCQTLTMSRCHTTWALCQIQDLRNTLWSANVSRAIQTKLC